MDAMGMALAVRLLLNANVDHDRARSPARRAGEFFLSALGSVRQWLFMAPGCSLPSDNAARCNPVGNAEFHT
jgi:hypothetical protein